jgi:hypothetical protein
MTIDAIERDRIKDNLQYALEVFDEKCSNHDSANVNNLSRSEKLEVYSFLFQTIVHASPAGSDYQNKAKNISEQQLNYPAKIEALVGLARSLLRAHERGLFSEFTEKVHQSIFDNMLDAAAYYLTEEDHDKCAAAVIVGGVLEQHLKHLCIKLGIGGKKISKAYGIGKFAAKLERKKVITEPDKKRIAKWRNVRDKAAHGNNDKYDEDDVNSMIDGVRNFLATYPA